MADNNGLYILMISAHGLIRGNNLELGRDPDTGGQTKYVVDLVKTLGKHPDVFRVDLITRMIYDSKVSEDYSKYEEQIAPNGYIIRIPWGPKRYLRKEVLWPYIESLADNTLQHIRRIGRIPDIIHGHYADAGYAGSLLAKILGVHLVFTGHSLGRVKQQRLIDQGVKPEIVEKQYHISRRIEAEEQSLYTASFVVASTNQEVAEQYSIYDNYYPKRMLIIPPGVLLDSFYPPKKNWVKPNIANTINKFYKEPNKPIILALSRPDPRKNIPTLIRAYGSNSELRDKANLLIIAGNRDDISTMDKASRGVLTELLILIDKYDLYGKVAIPKHHKADEVPEIYRIVAKSGGVFINPALTEPFGLTLIEAAATGLPIVATEDGGPKDIILNCKNGIVIDPLDHNKMALALLDALSDKERWKQWRKNGITGAHRYYSWDAHVNKYLKESKKLLRKLKKKKEFKLSSNRLATVDRILICDIDGTLLGDRKSLATLMDTLSKVEDKVGFGVATGRRLESAISILKEWKVPIPDLIISSVGSEIHYGPVIVEDTNWSKHISYNWKPLEIHKIISSLPGLVLQAKTEQRKHKISYYIDPEISPSVKDIIKYLRRNDIKTNVIFSHGEFIDFLPIRSSKGQAVRHFALKWGIPFDRILVAGDSGNDGEMLKGNTLAVVVGNYSSELERLKGATRVHFTDGHYAEGILQGINYYDFFDKLRVPEEKSQPDEYSD